MLFNSTIFLFVFLPLCGLGYWLILRFIGRYAAYAMLLLASLTFYAWWDIGNLLLLLSLILVNFFLGEHLRSPASQNSKVRRGWLIAGVTLNLAVLGVFKYSNFILANLALVGVGNGSALSLLLPLGISFYTFQQIAYLIDCWKGRVRNGRLVDYSLFVLFFPQLIAGPIVHHRYFFHHLRRKSLKLFRRKYSQYVPCYVESLLYCSFFICLLTEELLFERNAECKECFDRLRSNGKPGKVAVVAVANKLVRQAFAVVTQEKPYVDGFKSKKP